MRRLLTILKVGGWSKVTLISFVVGFLTFVTFLATSATFFQGSNYDVKQYTVIQDAVLIALVGIGGLAFIVFCISLFIKLWLKSKALAFLIVSLVVIVFGSLFFAFFNQMRLDSERAKNFTGQELFDAINEYRQNKGHKSVALELALCDNLVQRYLDITNPDNTYEGHAGLERWVQNEGLVGKYELAELYVKDSLSIQSAIDFWDSSPGHRLPLQGGYTFGCAYANNGTAVVILGNKK